MGDPPIFDVAVAGAGPAGLACALAIARGTALSVAVIAPPPQGRDARTAALFPGSTELLRNLGVWQACQPHATALRAIRIVDAVEAPLPAPEVLFSAQEIGLEAFAWNVPNEAVTRALREAAQERAPQIAFVEAAVAAIAFEDGAALVRTSDGRTFAARLVVAADGRNSACRTAAGIGVEAWSYEQTAIVCSFEHARAHDGVSTEFHTTAGPMTTVPMPGRASSLVWVEKPDVAKSLMALADAEFVSALERRLRGLLGSVVAVGPRGAFPLGGALAATMAAKRVALVGEAGHVLPPIGAQGLNLGLRDAATLADFVAVATSEGRDIGGEETLSDYARRRGRDAARRGFAVGFLNRALLLSNWPPVHFARGLGMAALARVGPLRRQIMRGGLEPQADLPRLMRRDAGASSTA